MYNISSVIFDLDGVITKTATTHFNAWKQLFDNYLLHREKMFGESFLEFSENDYKHYIDGVPRYEGIQQFLKSRNISIDYGTTDDKPGISTICALGNLKNNLFIELIRNNGVEIYQSTIDLIKKCRQFNIKVAVASSSRNCRFILNTMNLSPLFDICIDGNDLAKLNLQGKPNPAIFTTAADKLHCKYSDSIIFEDAINGVRAGKNGNFGLVVGIARNNNDNELKHNGADIVVKDLNEIDIDDLGRIMKMIKEDDGWKIEYDDFDITQEKTRETLLSIGNGYLCSRSGLNIYKPGKYHYHATYLAGVYNKLFSFVNNKKIENDDLVNCGELWNLYIKCLISDNSTCKPKEYITDFSSAQIIDIKRILFLKDGVLSTTVKLKDHNNNQLLINSLRVISMHDRHAGAEKYVITPMNFSGKFFITSNINCNVKNAGVERYNNLNNEHLQTTQTYFNNNINNIIIGVETITNQSNIKIGIASKNICKTHDPQIRYIVDNANVAIEYSTDIQVNDSFVLEKIISIFNSKQDENYSNDMVINNLKKYNNYIDVAENSSYNWKRIWNKIDIKIDNDREKQKIIRLYLYHLMIACSDHNKFLDAGIGPRGLTGEAYRGHIFWDELFIFPFICKHFPDSAKSMLLYRYRRLNAAKQAAENEGYKGAMFPWQSGSDGSETTQTVHYNPISKKWDKDYSHRQRHISLSIAYNIFQYLNITNDIKFMFDYGFELLYEICRFWASIAYFDENSCKYHINNVMGPDEFHERTKDKSNPQKYNDGVKDNAYTNIMTSWLLTYVCDLESTINKTNYSTNLQKIHSELNVTDNEIQHWSYISKKLNLVIKNNIISQFDGYFDLLPVDFNEYKRKYGNIERMDRILKAENDSPDNYQISKQADLMMIFYNFPINNLLTKSEIYNDISFRFNYQVIDILLNMGYSLDSNFIKDNFDYYLNRTTHGSTLSKLVFSKVAYMLGENTIGEKLYHDALISDFKDTQATTAEGIHIGLMGGLIQGII